MGLITSRHARCSPQCRQYRRRNRRNQLHNEFHSFFLTHYSPPSCGSNVADNPIISRGASARRRLLFWAWIRFWTLQSFCGKIWWCDGKTKRWLSVKRQPAVQVRLRHQFALIEWWFPHKIGKNTPKFPNKIGRNILKFPNKIGKMFGNSSRKV